MQNLIAYMGNLAFNPPTLEIDGKIHRFDRNGKKKNAWYIGFQNHSLKTGEPYLICQFGDWREYGVIHLYRPVGVKLSKEDNDLIKKQIEVARKKEADEKKQNNIEAADKAEKFIASCQPGQLTDYLVRKKIDKPYGSLTKLADVGLITIIPIKDIEGKLWNYQRIFPDGNKKFSYGGKIDGCFHQIGEINDRVIICEGFATGASIYMATEIPVVIAFNTANLPKVAVDIRCAYPDIQIIIAGDDDREVKENPGRKAADSAAGKSNGTVIYPDIDYGTDFNDLHCKEGLDAVRDRFTRPAENTNGFVPLGYSKGIYYFFSFSAKEVVEVSSFSPVQLFALARREYWEAVHPGKIGIDWQGVQDDLIAKCKAVGPFDINRIRGTGVWYDKGRVVVNSGHDLLVDGQPISPALIKSWYVYQQTSNKFQTPTDNPLNIDESRKLVDLCTSFNWSDEKSGYFLAGWLAIARIAGALPVRPHVWLTGPSGSGKSTLMECLIANALGDRQGKLFVQGATTEAGIRQALSCSSVPLIFDEFETVDKHSKERISNVVQLLRQSWSITSGYLLKGSAGGTSTSYNVGFAALVSSVRVNIDNDADRSRFTLCELQPNKGNNDHWHKVKNELDSLDESFGNRLFVRSINQVKNILKSYAIFQKIIASKHTNRSGQQYGMLFAGLYSLMNDEPATVESAETLVNELFSTKEDFEPEESSDEIQCLQHLVTKIITIQNFEARNIEKTIAQAIFSNTLDFKEGLEKHGIIADDKYVYLSLSSNQIRKYYENTRWVKWHLSLRRLKGTKDDRKYFAKYRSRCIAIPLEYVSGDNK